MEFSFVVCDDMISIVLRIIVFLVCCYGVVVGCCWFVEVRVVFGEFLLSWLYWVVYVNGVLLCYFGVVFGVFGEVWLV